MPSLDAFHLSFQHPTLGGPESQPSSQKSFVPAGKHWLPGGLRAPGAPQQAPAAFPRPHSETSPARQRDCASAGLPRGRHCRLLPAGAGRGGALGAHPVNSGWSPPRSRPGSSAPVTRSPGALAHLADSILFPPPALPAPPPPALGPASLRARPAGALSALLGVLIGHPGPTLSP